MYDSNKAKILTHKNYNALTQFFESYKSSTVTTYREFPKGYSSCNVIVVNEKISYQSPVQFVLNEIANFSERKEKAYKLINNLKSLVTSKHKENRFIVMLVNDRTFSSRFWNISIATFLYPHFKG